MAPDRKVALGGAFKQEDRRAVLARAAREREARQAQRVQQRSAVRIQSAFRRRTATRSLATAQRAAFDALLLRATELRASTAGLPLLRALVRAARVFDGASPADACDGARRGALCELLLANAELVDAHLNYCTVMCAGALERDGGGALSCSEPAAWRAQMSGLVAICARAVVDAAGGRVGGGGDGSGNVARSAARELRLLVYLTDASAWAWLGALPSAAHAQRATRASLDFAIAAGQAGVHACAWARAAAQPGSGALELDGDERVLCALSIRALRAPGALGLPPAERRSAAQAHAFGAAALAIPGLARRLPEPLASQLLRAEAATLAHAIEALGAAGDDLIGALAPHGAARGAAAPPPSPLAPLALLGNVLDLAPGLVASAHAARTLAAYVGLLSALLRPWVDAHTALEFRRATARACDSSDDDDDDNNNEPGAARGVGGRGAGAAAARSDARPMELDGSPPPGLVPAEHAALVDAQLHALVGGALASRLFSAVLSAEGGLEDAGQPADARVTPTLSRLCALYCLLLAHGAPRSASPSADSGAQSAVLLLSALAFASGVAPRLWARLEASVRAAGGGLGAWSGAEVEGPLCLFCQLANHALVVLSDDELLGLAETDLLAPTTAAAAAAAARGGARASPLLPRAQLRAMCLVLKEVAVHQLWSASAAVDGGRHGPLLRAQLTKLLRAMHERDTRRPFVCADRAAWLAGGSASGKAAAIMAVVQSSAPPVGDDVERAPARPAAGGGASGASGSGLLVAAGGSETERAMAVLRSVPFALPFEGRLGALRAWIGADRQRFSFELAHHIWPPPIQVRRPSLLEDSFDALRDAGARLKLPLRVQFFNEQGLEEAGIGEGVMKEYLVDVIRAACAPAARLFAATGDGLLYPDPAARHALRESSARFEFAGALFAKALYEGILLDVPLAPFFLAKALGRANTVNDLPSLDPTLHKNLFFLKSYEGAVDDLALVYAVTDVVDGREYTTDLKPNGRNVPVTSADRTEYIYLVANYRLNAQLRRPCAAFLRGFTSVIPASWVAMFSPCELALVISGSDAPIDVADWRAHTRYASGYHDQHPVIAAFWAVVEAMTPVQRAVTLKFATSAARPPLLGFQWLTPPFCIQMTVTEEGRLPTSATCMNLLKLPPYEDLETMRAKLTYAVNAGCGFELS